MWLIKIALFVLVLNGLNNFVISLALKLSLLITKAYRHKKKLWKI